VQDQGAGDGAGLIAEAMALAIELSGQERLGADRPVTAAWLLEGLDAIAYDQPSGADADGFVTVGELRDVRAERLVERFRQLSRATLLLC
jgi:hypothetical protein